MNPLLKRQLRKYLPDDLKDREDLDVFLKAVSGSYDTLENQFKMTQRAMMLSSEELFEANKLLRQETTQQKSLLDRLQAVIHKANPDNIDEVLPIFVYGSEKQAKAAYPELDEAIANH